MLMYDTVESRANAGAQRSAPMHAIIKFFLILFNILSFLYLTFVNCFASLGGKYNNGFVEPLAWNW